MAAASACSEGVVKLRAVLWLQFMHLRILLVIIIIIVE